MGHRGTVQEAPEIQLRVPLKGEVLKKFRSLKARYGLDANTEVFRLILNQTYVQTMHRSDSAHILPKETQKTHEEAIPA